MSDKHIQVYTDGSSQGNPGPGGYGVVLKYGNHRKELSQGYRLTTNNRMELLAVIVALETIKAGNYLIKVHSDSKYVVDAINKKWIDSWATKGFKKKKNPDLWRRFLAVRNKHQVEYIWVKGHAGIPENERCDELANEAAVSDNLLVDKIYEETNGG
jgi:ribonuclease HI